MIVMGIDAAWTATEPSGVAVARGQGSSWECVAVAPSYAAFIALAKGTPVDWSIRPAGTKPDPAALIDAVAEFTGAKADVIAVDMPLSTVPIVTRRTADDAVSAAFGARGCAVHTPNAVRPGPIAENMRNGFAARGFQLACASTPPGRKPALLEVFPHTALLKLLGADYRVPYKASKTRTYWPEHSIVKRRASLVAVWKRIVSRLSMKIRGISLPIPRSGTIAGLKRYEDALDALVCAWIGIEYLAGRAVALGDAQSAIWNVEDPQPLGHRTLMSR